jgi:signal-transduction protein with cAMP-binding, CBS, and nucleotidyltransferase domain
MGTVARIMTKDVKTVDPTTTVRTAAKQMKDARLGSLFVKKGTAIVGIVTDTDLVRRALASDKDLNSLTVQEIMTSPLCSIEETRTIGDAHDMMGDLGVRHLGVTKAGEVVGVISVRDLLSFYQRISEPKIAQD